MKNFSFIKNKKIFYLITAVIVVIGILSIIFRGFNWDIDFVGGTELSYSLSQTIDRAGVEDLEKTVKDIVGDKFSSIRAAGDNNDQIIIRTKVLDADQSGSEQREAIQKAITEKYPETVLLSADNVSAEISNDLRASAILATSIAVLLMLVYIAIRFQISSAFAAIVCLVHDIFIMLTAYSILQIPVNSTVIAALLTILGYSINATIIIFDRIRENNKLLSSSTFGQRVDVSIRQTMARSINTTITTLLTIGMVFLLGVTSIREFALPLIVGILAGLYSSVLLAGPLWSQFKKKTPAETEAAVE